jgi:hypothetical protein
VEVVSADLTREQTLAGLRRLIADAEQDGRPPCSILQSALAQLTPPSSPLPIGYTTDKDGSIVPGSAYDGDERYDAPSEPGGEGQVLTADELNVALHAFWRGYNGAEGAGGRGYNPAKRAGKTAAGIESALLAFLKHRDTGGVARIRWAIEFKGNQP